MLVFMHFTIEAILSLIEDDCILIICIFFSFLNVWCTFGFIRLLILQTNK